MKKRYFYVVASFMRKDIAYTWRKVDIRISTYSSVTTSSLRYRT